MSQPPLISVIVLNWNGAAVLPRCLDALAAQTFADFETLVLDNASTDGSVESLGALWPGFRLLRFERNLGFAAGNNRGAALAQGRWLAFLNNDAFPEPDWLACLAQAADEHPEFTFFASRLVSAADPGRVLATGDVLHAGGAAWSRDNGRTVEQAQHPMEEVFSASAAAAMYDRQAFTKVGGFTEAFGSHLEDVDLGFRLRLRGGRCLYVPEAIVAHVGGASYGVESERTVYQVQRNRIWMYWMDMPGRLFWKHLPAHLLANGVFLAYYTLRGRAKAAWRAYWDALRGLPATLRRRRSIQAQRRVAPAEIERLLDRSLAGPYLLGKRGARLRRVAGDSSVQRPRTGG